MSAPRGGSGPREVSASRGWGGVGTPLLVLKSSGGHCNGRYASYWNAFLLDKCSGYLCMLP